MDKITLTANGQKYIQQHFGNGHLPVITRQPSDLQQENKTFQRQTSKGKLDVTSLRHLLRDDSIAEMQRLKEQTNNRAYMQVKHELMRDISNSKEFLQTKAENMAKKMLAEIPNNQQLQTEIGKGRNYLSKIVGEYEAQKEEDEKLWIRLKERAKGTC